MKAMELRRILCPIDFTDSSRRTVEGASILAAMYDAELRLFHVVSDGSDGRDAENLIASLFALTRSLPGRTRVSAALAYGDPSSEITQHARLMRADLIVLGADARSAPIGCPKTVAATITTHAPCPVLIVRPAFARSLADGGQGFVEILCCGDFLPGSTERVNCALALGDRAHARVTLLNVLSEENDPAEPEHETDEVVDEGIHAVHVALTGSPGPEIVALAQRIQSDLIVMSPHAETSAEPRLGSTTAFVMARATCPVLIVPCPAQSHSHGKSGGYNERDLTSPFSTCRLYR